MEAKEINEKKKFSVIQLVKRYPRVFALVLMLSVAIPMMLSPIGYLAINPIIENDERIIVMDGLFSYDANYVYEVFYKLGVEGRNTYFIFHIFDNIFAITYCILLMTLLKPVTKWNKKWIWIVFSVLPAAFDLIENTLIQIMSFQFPYINQSIAWAASLFTSMKYGALIAWVIAFVTMVVMMKTKKTLAPIEFVSR